MNIEEQALLFSVLADSTRLKLLKLLRQQTKTTALCVNALAFRLGITQSAVSQHLRILKSAGMVKAERRGYRIHYFISEQALIRAQEQISVLFNLGNKTVDRINPGTKNETE